MFVVWAVFLLELFVYFLFKSVVSDVEMLSFVLIAVNLVVLLMYLSRYAVGTVFLLIGALFARVVFMLWDIYARSIYVLPHSGSDTEGFLATGMGVADDLSVLGASIYGGLYTKVLGLLFWVGPEDRLMGQYLNVLIGMTTIVIVLKIFGEWDIKETIQRWCLVGMAFFPSAIIFSSILLREAFISFLVVLSFYFFLRWYREAGLVDMAIAVGVLLIGTFFHSGVIGVIVGYAFMLVFYNHEEERLEFSVKSVVPFGMVGLAGLYMTVVPLESIPFLSKFAFYMDNPNGIYEMASGSEGSDGGGSRYLTQLTIDTPWEIVVFAPLKMFYFLSSPLPWGWRGFNDIASFSYDGFIYLILLVVIVVKFRERIVGDPLLMGALIMVLSTVFIFGVGVDNAGTSMRHRYKLVYLLMLLAVFVLNKSDDQEEKETEAMP
ncbi:hypothetical protein [Thalassobacillus hwangdonensis]|uniref:Glycosyltransferase RgtA/B/C/D-like domain-containing protein n=1 Tax=Thalassobacillus hwangdonensis TaxID=546108 RepID=A0ABW3L2P4_9BACI